jgi:beta-phosphoglucomutase
MRYGVIFDMDGVLVDSQESHFWSWHELGKRHGVPHERELFNRTFGMHNAQIVPIWLGRAVSPEELQRLADEKEELFRAHVRTRIHPLEGAQQLVRGLREAGFALAVGSSGPRLNVETILDGLDLRSCFHALITGDDVSHGKPHPEVFQKATRALGLPAASCVVVEDAPQGVEAALAAGNRVVAITSTRPATDLRDADRIVQHLDEISPRTLEELIQCPR